MTTFKHQQCTINIYSYEKIPILRVKKKRCKIAHFLTNTAYYTNILYIFIYSVLYIFTLYPLFAMYKERHSSAQFNLWDASF